jgi:hypothetical protein
MRQKSFRKRVRQRIPEQAACASSQIIRLFPFRTEVSEIAIPAAIFPTKLLSNMARRRSFIFRPDTGQTAPIPADQPEDRR